MARKYKKKAYKKGKSYKRSATRVPKKLKKYVNRVVARQIQNKTVQRVLDQTIYTNVIANTDVYSLMPSISQGTGQADREGNKIRLRKAYLRLTAATLTGIASSQYVDIYIFKNKYGNAIPTAAEMAKFLENGNSSTSYAGLPVTRLRPVNPDIFTLKKKFTMLLASPTTGASGSLRPTGYRVADITSCFKKVWHYDDVAATPTDENLFITVGATDPQNQTFQNYGEYSFCVDYEYEDA